jgi:hypothetical protein
VQAVGLCPLPVRGARRGGYHSEGYFSSDQDEDLRGRGDFFVKKFKSLEKGKFLFHVWYAVFLCSSDPPEHLENCQP